MVVSEEQQKEIIRLKKEGKRKNEIAQILHISKNSVRKYWGNGIEEEEPEEEIEDQEENGSQVQISISKQNYEQLTGVLSLINNSSVAQFIENYLLKILKIFYNKRLKFEEIARIGAFLGEMKARDFEINEIADLITTNYNLDIELKEKKNLLIQLNQEIEKYQNNLIEIELNTLKNSDPEKYDKIFNDKITDHAIIKLVNDKIKEYSNQ